MPPKRPALVAAATKKSYPKAKITDYDANAPSGKSFPGQQPYDDPWVKNLVTDGVNFWAKRSVRIPGQVAIDVADDLEDVSANPRNVAGRGWTPSTAKDGTARIALRRDYINSLLKTARDNRYSTKDRRTALKKAAVIIYHELGHAGGLDHTEGGLMGAEGDITNPNDYSKIPYSSVKVIRKLLPYEKPRGKRSARGIG